MRRPRISRGQVNAIEGAAAAVSGLCLVHCLALPAFLLLLPMTIGMLAKSEWFHVAAVLLVIPIASAVMVIGFRRHTSLLPGLLAATGALFLIVGLLGNLPELSGAVLMASGSGILLLSHALNWRLRVHAA